MKTISRYIMTLALLLTAVTGAWAEDTYNVTFKANGNTKTVENITLPHTFSCNVDDETGRGTDELDVIIQELYGLSGNYCLNTAPNSDNASVTCGMDDADLQYIIVNAPFNGTATVTGKYIDTNYSVFDYTLEITCAAAPAEAPITVAWNASTKTGTFEMPGSDVVLTPIYAKAAAFATTGTEPEVTTLLPAAAEGVIAGTDASLIAEGTGIVAFAGTSAEVTQGTLMYAIGTSATEAPALTTFSPTVPTAKTVADDGADVYVWYYIKGADAPDGQQATEENTFDNTEPACLTVTVLTNKFDIQFNAANANTIEAGKATVTVDGQSATVTEGKLEGVKMGTEVKLKANTGYKFRKVEVKKKAAAPSLNITNPEVGQIIGSDGKNYAAANVPSGVDKVAMIAYVSGSNGLAIALADEGMLNWATAKSTCEAKTPAFTNGTWKLPSQDEWKQMFSANGGSEGNYDGLNTAITTAGGTAFQDGTVNYWSSSEYDSDQAHLTQFYYGYASWFKDWKVNDKWVRAVLAF